MTANLLARVPFAPFKAGILLIIPSKRATISMENQREGEIHLPVWCGYAWRWRGTDVAPLKTSLEEAGGGAG